MSDVPAWMPIGFIDDSAVETGYRLCVSSAGGNTQIILALELERKGGPCPVCQRKYQVVVVKNRFADFKYYEPACLCFKRCDVCGLHLVAERLLDIHHCTYCHPKGTEIVKREHARRKRSYHDGKAAAAGEES